MVDIAQALIDTSAASDQSARARFDLIDFS